MAQIDMPKAKSSLNDTTSLPANSNVSSKTKAIVSDQTQRAKQITKGRTIKTHDGFFSKLIQNLISDDPSSVKTYLIDDILIPGVKDLIANAINLGIDAIFFGSGSEQSFRKSRTSQNGRVSYQKYYDQNTRGRQRYSNHDARRSDADDILVETRREAQEILNELNCILEEYDQVSVGDLYDAAGMTTNFTMYKYGWFNLSNARIRQVRDGYLIIMPQTHLLE